MTGFITEAGRLRNGDRFRCAPDRRSDFLSNESGGGTNANGNYSVTPATFSYGPSAGENWTVERLIIHIGDTGSFSSDEYGNTGSALSNGFDVEVVDSGDNVIKKLNGARPFTTNGELGSVCYDVSNLGAGTGGNDAILVRWTFSKAGSPIRLRGDDGWKVRVVLNDDFSGLAKHTFFLDCYLS